MDCSPRMSRRWTTAKTCYRAELNITLPGLEDMSTYDVKKTVDIVLTDPATASAVESKTIKLGISRDEVKKSLGNPDKIVDLGVKQNLRLQIT